MIGANTQISFRDIHARALDATLHWDAVPAWSIYRELEKFLREFSTGQKLDPKFIEEITVLKRNLLVVGFPALPQEEAVKLFRGHILDFFRVDVDFKERLMTRYMSVGYGNKEEERKCLEQALLQNNERFGKLTIGEWIKLFEQRFKRETRDKKTAATFLLQTSEAATLGKTEQAVLGKILAVYDEYICREVLDEIDMAMADRKTNPSQSSPYISKQSSGQIGQTIDLPLLQALSKYENLGNQLITAERIRVKSQPEPVRPSLLYWLKCYRDELGIGQHDTVERGDFLFRSVNGKNLSPEERERVNLILKSIEENLPLMIDTKRQEIIFPASNAVSIAPASRSAYREIPINKQKETKTMPLISTIRTNNLPQDATFFKPGQSDLDDIPMSQSIHSQNPFKKEEISKTKNMTMSFSAGHIFPAEKEAIEKKEETIQEEGRSQKTIPTVPIPSFAPIHQSPQNRKVSNDFNPFIIHPRGNGNEENDN